jgi:hypothetical protein
MKGKKNILKNLDPFIDPDLVKEYGYVIVPNINQRFTIAIKSKELIRSTWTEGKSKKAVVFGVIYKWTNKKNGKFMWGRTEQRPIDSQEHPLLGAISPRLIDYIQKSKYYNTKDDSIYSAMHDIYITAGKGNKGIKVIKNIFDVRIEEIIFESGDFEYDCHFIEAVEQSYISITSSDNPNIGYNIRGGSVGSHKGHSKKVIDKSILGNLIKNGRSQEEIEKYFKVDRKTIFNRIKEYWSSTKGNWYEVRRLLLKPEILKYVKQGYSQEEIRRFFPSSYNKDGFMSRSQIYQVFQDCFEGKSFKGIQENCLGSLIDCFNKEGLLTPIQLAPKFKGLDEIKIWTFLVNNRESYLKLLITFLISKGYRTTIKLAEKMGINQWNVERFIEKSMRGIRTEVIESFDRPLARNLMYECNRYIQLLQKMGYKESTIQTYISKNKINDLIKKIFGGKSFDEVKLLNDSN